MNKYTRKIINKSENEFVELDDRLASTISKISDALFEKWIPSSLNIGVCYLTGVPVWMCNFAVEYVALTVKTYHNYEKFKVCRDAIYDYTKKELTKRNLRFFN